MLVVFCQYKDEPFEHDETRNKCWSWMKCGPKCTLKEVVDGTVPSSEGGR